MHVVAGNMMDDESIVVDVTCWFETIKVELNNANVKVRKGEGTIRKSYLTYLNYVCGVCFSCENGGHVEVSKWL